MRKTESAIPALLLPAILAACSGCIFFYGSTTGRPVDEAALKTLTTGAKRVEVERSLGLPSAVASYGESRLIYHYQYTREKTFLLFLIGHTNQEDDNVYIFFDDRGNLVDKKGQYLTKDLGWRLWPFGR